MKEQGQAADVGEGEETVEGSLCDDLCCYAPGEGEEEEDGGL